MPEIFTRAEAKALGLKRYFTGKPCPRGHISERIVSQRGCCRCVAEREMDPEYKRKKRDYAAQNPEIGRRRSREWNRKNPEKRAAMNNSWRERHPDRVRELRRNSAKSNYATAKAWKERNREKCLQYKRKSYVEGPSNPKGEAQWLRKNKAQLRTVKRQLRNLGATPSPSVA